MHHRGIVTSRRNRRASAYALLLGSAVIVTLIGLTSIQVARSRIARAAGDTHILVARDLAYSAVELAITSLQAAPTDWRSHYTHNVEVGPFAIGDGTASWRLLDPDNNLANDTSDLVTVVGTGRMGDAVQLFSVVLSPSAGSPDFLRTVIHADFAVDLITTTANGSPVVMNAMGGPVSTNGQLWNWSTINGDVEANRVNNHNTINGTIVTGAPAKAMPSASIWDTYRALAVEIPVTSMTWNSGKGRYDLDPALLTPTINPYGAPSPDGVYYVNVPAGTKIQFDHARFEGTLIVEGTNGSIFHYGGHIMARPARADYPLTIVRNCDLELDSRGPNGMDESASGKNFNPPEYPYEGTSNTNMTDFFPSEIRGLVHSIGGGSSVKLYTAIHFIGTIVAEGEVSYPFGKQVPNAMLTHDPDLYASPPIGYSTSGVMLPVAGTIKRELQ